MSVAMCTEAGMHLTSILSGAKHCLPTYLPYVFYEASRATDAIYPASIATAILAVLLIFLLDCEAAMTLVDRTKNAYRKDEALIPAESRRYRPVPV